MDLNHSPQVIRTPVLALPLPRVKSVPRPPVLGALHSLLLHSVTLKRLSVDVESVIQELVAAADADGRASITYEQFVGAIEGLDSSVRAMLTATVFAKMPKDERGAVPIIAIARYLRQRMALRGVYAKMQTYDIDRDGCLSEQELENMVFDSIPHVPDLAVRELNIECIFRANIVIRPFKFVCCVHFRPCKRIFIPFTYFLPCESFSSLSTLTTPAESPSMYLRHRQPSQSG
jgi:hypothetical protein